MLELKKHFRNKKQEANNLKKLKRIIKIGFVKNFKKNQKKQSSNLKNIKIIFDSHDFQLSFIDNLFENRQ